MLASVGASQPRKRAARPRKTEATSTKRQLIAARAPPTPVIGQNQRTLLAIEALQAKLRAELAVPRQQQPISGVATPSSSQATPTPATPANQARPLSQFSPAELQEALRWFMQAQKVLSAPPTSRPTSAQPLATPTPSAPPPPTESVQRVQLTLRSIVETTSSEVRKGHDLRTIQRK